MKLLAWVGLFALSTAACGGDGVDRSSHGYVAHSAMASGTTLYVGGVFREPENAAGNQLTGHEMLVILDASDPATPTFVAEFDLGLTQPFAVVGGQLIAAQHGADETMLDRPDAPPRQNPRVKVFDLADPTAPVLDKTIDLPCCLGATISATQVIDVDEVLITVGDGTEGAGSPLTWIVRPGAAAGSEIVGSADVACRAPVVDGTTLWCFDGLGLGTGFVVGFDLAGDGRITERARVDVAPFILPLRSAVATDGAVVVSDLEAGTFAMGRDLAGVPSVPGTPVEQGGAGVVAIGDGRVILQGTGLRVVEAATLTEVSVLAGNFVGGSSIRRLDATGDLDGLYAAAFGDDGVLLVREDAGTLTRVGGYYRRFGDNLGTRNTLQEGNY